MVLRRVWGGACPPPQRRKNEGLRNADPVYAVLGLCVVGMGVLAPPLAASQNHGFVSRSEGGWPPSPQDKI